jgi:hypothetical protein
MHKYGHQGILWGYKRNIEKAVSLCTLITLDGVLKSFGMAGKKERDQLPQTVYQKMREWNV